MSGKKKNAFTDRFYSNTGVSFCPDTGSAANPKNTDSREMEISARFHRGRASLVATFPVNLFRPVSARGE